jgi:uncharacterized protein (DUF2252 family)
VADAKGRVKIAIRDLDQAVIGNPAHDLVRLGLSLATAIRGSDLPGVTTALMLEQMVRGYEGALANPGKHPRKSTVPASVRSVLRRALKRRWHHLAEERIEDVRPQIPMGKRFWPITAAEKKEIERIFKLPEVRELITSLKDRDKDDAVEVVDAAYWMKGCSSLGRLRYAVLLGIGKKKKNSEGFCLIDIKEAVPAAAPHAANAPMPRDYARRVVEGARKLSPHLGERMLPGHFLGTPAVLRELLPQDLKLEMDQLTRGEAIGAARFLASVVGVAHAQQMNKGERREWSKCLKRIAARSSMRRHGCGRVSFNWSPSTSLLIWSIAGNMRWTRRRGDELGFSQFCPKTKCRCRRNCRERTFPLKQVGTTHLCRATGFLLGRGRYFVVRFLCLICPRIDGADESAEFLVRLFFLFESLFEERNMLRLAKFLREGDNCPVTGHFIVFDPLRGADKGGIQQRAVVLLDGFRAFLNQHSHAFGLLALGTFAKLLKDGLQTLNMRFGLFEAFLKPGLQIF